MSKRRLLCCCGAGDGGGIDCVLACANYPQAAVCNLSIDFTCYMAQGGNMSPSQLTAVVVCQKDGCGYFGSSPRRSLVVRMGATLEYEAFMHVDVQAFVGTCPSITASIVLDELLLDGRPFPYCFGCPEIISTWSAFAPALPNCKCHSTLGGIQWIPAQSPYVMEFLCECYATDWQAARCVNPCCSPSGGANSFWLVNGQYPCAAPCRPQDEPCLPCWRTDVSAYSVTLG